MPDTPQLGRAVDHRRFVQRRVDARQRRQVDDAAKAEVLPDARPHVDRLEIGRIAHEVDRSEPQML